MSLSHLQQHAGVEIGKREPLRVISCVMCGYSHLWPLPSEEDLLAMYREEYYESIKPDYIEKDFREERYWNQAFADRLQSLKGLSSGRTLLDIGCGSGRFLKFVVENGWDAIGIEPSQSAVRVAQAENLPVFNENLNEYADRCSKQYHVLHNKNVLEHVLDPLDHLKLCHKLLLPGGILYIEVPNDFELLQRACTFFGLGPQSWIVREHISYFTFSSLRRLLERAGFEVLCRDTTFPMYLFPLLGLNFIRRPEVGARCHQFRMMIESIMVKLGLGGVLRVCYRLLANLGLGRTVIYYARKR